MRYVRRYKRLCLCALTRSNLRTLRDLNSDSDAPAPPPTNAGSDRDQAQNFYTGGAARYAHITLKVDSHSLSGMLVENPNANRGAAANNLVRNILQQAATQCVST